MGKPTTKKKKHHHPTKSNSKNSRSSDHSSPKVFDEDTTIFTDMSHDMKEEGNRLFQKRDYETALLKYEKAIKLLPKSHVDIPYLRSNIATCYMQMGSGEYHQAINECNLALEASPKYTKALLKRAKCYEALSRLESAYRDVSFVLSLEPNNMMATEILERVKKSMEKKGIAFDDKGMFSPPEVVVVKERSKKKKSHKVEKVEDKVVMEVKCNQNHDNKDDFKKEEPMRAVKLVFGEDIRCSQVPGNCSILQLREVVRNRFPSLKSVLIKYKDKEGDLVTITTSEELRWAEESGDPQGSVRLYITEVDPEHEPLFEDVSRRGLEVQGSSKRNYFNSFSDYGSMRYYEEKDTCIDSWTVQFARLFKNHVGFNTDAYLDLHEIGMKLYSEAMEDIVTNEEAQGIFDIATDKFQEMTALALFNWGNVHMSRARKRLLLSEDASRESVLAQVKASYEWAQGEYVKAGRRYDESLKLKPDFYDGFFALGQQQFEQAKLSWYYAIGSKLDLETWPSTEVLDLFNKAEDNMERGMEMWTEMEEERLKKISQPNKEKALLEKMGLDRFFKDISSDEAAELSSNMRSQINILWGTMLYERSVVEFKLGVPVWEECLLEALDKFRLAGASPTDIAVMEKNHCANETTLEGLSFKIDEIVQAWNEMYDAKRWISGVSSFRLEPLFRRRVPKLHHTLEHL